MIKRVLKNLGVYDGRAPAESAQLEREGWAFLPGSSTAPKSRR